MTALSDKIAQFASDVDKAHQFIHGAANDEVITEGGNIPTLATIASQLAQNLVENTGTNSGDETVESIKEKLGIETLSGVNTGDETDESIKDKLGIETLSGVNTGDETEAGIKEKLNITTLSGVNTGDETAETIKQKLGVETMAGVNTGDETLESIKTKLGIEVLSGDNTGDETVASIKTKLGIDTLSGANTGDETVDTIKQKLGINTLSGVNTGDQTLNSLGIPNVENKSSATIRGEITSDNVKGALGYVPVDAATIGEINGLAPLGADRKIDATYLPDAYVDEVIEVANYAALPLVGVASKIYVTQDENFEYRWGGSAYIRLVQSPGTTDALTEGVNNKYFTLQRVRDTLMAGLSLLNAGAVVATDSFLVGMGKLQKQVTDNYTSLLSVINALTDAVTAKIDSNKIGAANGVAPLGADGLISSAYLPAGVGGGGSYTGVFPGAVTAQVGTQRTYPKSNTTISSITAWLSSPAATDVVAKVRKNGVVVQTITILAGQSTVTAAAAIGVLTTDYLTLDVVSGSGWDLTIRLDY